jgi:circadian clock protein KaiC
MGIELCSSGLPKLDEVLNGGLVTGRVYLLTGKPGTGKTTLGMHFLEAGLEHDETVLFIHGEETKQELMTSANSVGIDIEDAAFLDLGPESEQFTTDQPPKLVSPSELEQGQFTDTVYTRVNELDPDRIVFDPITQFRYISLDETQFRRQTLAFLRFLKSEDVTVVSTATPMTDRDYYHELRSLSDAIIELTRGQHRTIEVLKHRSVGQIEGTHGLEIRNGGLEVYPALTPDKHQQQIPDRRIPTGIDELDTLLHGGIEQNTVTFLSGPTGVGKTSLATQLATGTGTAGTTAAYLFEESIDSFITRTESLGIPVSDLQQEDELLVQAIEPLAHSAEEFASIVQYDVAEQGVDTVLIDGIDGYTMALQGGEERLLTRLHSLTRYLTNNHVTIFVTDEISNVTGISSATSVNASYIADNIIALNYIEKGSEIRRIVAVLKKRTGTFENTFREYTLSADGIHVSTPLEDMTGILQGMPQ